MVEISFTDGEAWSNFYNRMTADNYDYYLLCFKSGYYYGSAILTREYLDLQNSGGENENVVVAALRNNSGIRDALMRKYQGKMNASDLWKIYGIKL